MEQEFMKEEELDLSIFCTEQDYKAVVHHDNCHKESHQGTTLLYQTRQPFDYYYKHARQFNKKVRYREKTPEAQLKQRQVEDKKRVQYMEKLQPTTISVQLIANSSLKVEKPPEEESHRGAETKEPEKQFQIQSQSNVSNTHQEEQIICLVVSDENSEVQSSPFSKGQRCETEFQGQVSSPIALDSIDFEEIPIIQLTNQQEMPKKRRKIQRHKKQLIAFNTNQQSLTELSNISRRRNPFSFSLQPFNLAKQLQGEQEDLLQQFRNIQFRVLTVKFVFRGPIQAIKIKSIMVSLFSSDQIKIEKDKNNEYTCEEIYRNVVDIIDNVYHSWRRREYENSQKEVQLELCRIRLPNYSFKKHYPTQKVQYSPVTINKISVVCYCSRKSEFVLSSLGGTCKNCSLPFQLSIKNISIA